ncbi:MAG: branched-chain amino acid transaminase [Deltaproteobacteria bacterium]|nr:branched-chain amino acid transaminase [Deltaproteobacteria bacterium]
MQKLKWIWHDGEMLPWDQARVHILTHSLHYGFAAFEGMRCYAQNKGGAAVFRLREHIDRLFNTAHVCLLQVPCSREVLTEACQEIVRKNDLTDGCYIRPLVYVGEGEMGIAAMNNPVHVAVIAWRWGAYLGEEGVKSGIRAKISSFRRPASDAWVPKGKITGQYVNSILAKREAVLGGYQEAIMLDAQGFVCEGSGENIFIVEGNKVRTPWIGEAILAGITRDTVIRLLEDQGIKIEAGPIGRGELFCADEVFLTGTAAEITPVREVDDRKIGDGKPGPLTRRLQDTFKRAVRGELPQYAEWLTRV